MYPKIVIVGSTGKLGSKLLNYTYKNNITIFAITCFQNKKKILSQKKKFGISNYFILSQENEVERFNNFLKNKINIIYFLDFGSFSLTYLNQFIKTNTRSIIAIANKEMIIAGGKPLINSISKSQNQLIPLDSEHFSLKNSFLNKDVKKIFITASGGPFYFSNKKSFDNVSFKEVLTHPKWKMGKNNLIDSSNFINKILEIYEVSIIYNIPISKIDFIISRQAFIHSIVFFNDGIISLNSFKNDMLLTLIHPLNGYFKLKEKIFSEEYLSNIDNFQFSNKQDKRFVFFNYYKKMRDFDHKKQIIFLLLNNHAQSLYLSNKLKYDHIIPYTMKNIDNYYNKKKLISIPSILKFIKSIKNQIQND